ncbi:MAG: hypothetical protein ABI856_19930, partial [Nitrospira sp.]
DEDAIIGFEHFERLDGARDLFVDKGREAVFAEGGIVPRKADHGFRLTLPAIHEYPYRVRG